MSNSITAIVLTYNEELNLSKCLLSLSKINADIVLVDSYSNDSTICIAEEYNARIYKNSWINYSKQFNWALENIEIASDWILRIDADEYLDDELVSDINLRLFNLPPDITSIYLNRAHAFNGKILNYSRFNRKKHLKIWRRGFGYCQDTWMDEHIIVDQGDSILFRGKLIDDNRKNTLDFISKHTNYAVREAIHYFMLRTKSYKHKNFHNTSELDTIVPIFLRKLYYGFIPSYLRPWLLFIYEYFICFGFLDGKSGYYYLIFQVLFYRSLVESIIEDANSYSKGNTKKLEEFFSLKYNFKIKLLQ